MTSSLFTGGVPTQPHPHLLVRSDAQTKRAGALFSEHLRSGDVLALVGPLGAGKTTFVQGLAEGLGHTGPVTSPTFALLQTYEKGRLQLYHADLYRLEKSSEWMELGLEEWIEGDAVLAVEWADRFPQALPRPPLWIEIVVGKEPDTRVLRAWGESARTRALASILIDLKL